MSITHINNLQDQILQSIKTLPLEKQQKVLEFHHEIKDGVQQKLRDKHQVISKLDIKS